MNSKYLILVPLIAQAIYLPSSIQASPLVSVGDNAEILLNASAGATWQSNVSRTETEEIEDLIWTLSPGVKLNVGRGVSNADFSVTTRYDIVQYTDNGEFDNETFHVRASGSYKGSRLSLRARAGFDENKSTTGFDGEGNPRGELIEAELVEASVNGEYRVSSKFSFAAGFEYDERDYVTQKRFFSDREAITLPFDIFYEFTPKVDLSVGYRYKTTDFAGREARAEDAYTREEHDFNVGARGDLLPKLNGFFRVGYSQSESDRASRGASDGIFSLKADLNWAATPKLNTKLELSRRFGAGGNGFTTENTSANLSARYAINSNWSGSGNLSYTIRDYHDGREDDQYRAGVRLTYVPDLYWQFSSGYSYNTNESNVRTAGYTNHMLDLKVALRY